MSTPDPSATVSRISPDSDAPWTTEGAWKVAPGIHRIPLPLPKDGLRAVNVYVVELPDGLLLIDGGWAISEARETLERSLRLLGSNPADIRQILVTHVHRDHYTLASVLAHELGVEVVLGAAERPALDLIRGATPDWRTLSRVALADCGARELADQWEGVPREEPNLDNWRLPDRWLEGDTTLEVGRRTLEAVHTPGHTPGHFVYVERAAEILFAGDHVLPTITPSIGYTLPVPPDPLGDFMASLAKIRALPDLVLLPAHGPIASSSHDRVDELLTHHERRLALIAAALHPGGSTAYEIAAELPWTRRDRDLTELDLFNRSLATRETQAHLELLAARGEATRQVSDDGVVRFFAASYPGERSEPQ